MHILVTGGTGFLGKQLVARLIEQKNRLFLLTRDSSKVCRNVREKAEIFEGDIKNPEFVRSLKITQKIDAVLHLAASLDYFGDRKTLFEVNVKGTVNLLKWREENKAGKFVFVSSVEAMGPVEEKEIPADERHKCSPCSTYGESKLEAERQVIAYGKKNGSGNVILRVGNVYGPGSTSFIMPVAASVIRKDALFNFLPSYGGRFLHLIYIEDAVEGIMQALAAEKAEGLYILAGKEYGTIKALFDLTSQSIGMDFNPPHTVGKMDLFLLNLRRKIFRMRNRADLITYLTSGEKNRVHRAYSILKAERELGFSPETELKEGIIKTVDWLRSENLYPPGAVKRA